MKSNDSKRKWLLHRSSLVIVALVMFVSGAFVGRGGFIGAGADSALENEPAFAAFSEAWELIQERYVAPDTINNDDLIYSATRAMVEAVGDTGHTTFLTPLEVETSDPNLTGEFVGIGVEMDFEGDYPKVVTPIDNSPADAAGILPGDLFIAVDGVDLAGKSSADISALIRGEEGTSVDITIRRQGVDDFTLTLIRSKIVSDPVSWWMIDGNVAQIRFGEFVQGAADQLQEAVDDARAAGATSFILDLRNNPGGLVSEGLDVAGIFLSTGTVVFQIEDREGNRSPQAVDDGADDFTEPLVVLINGSSASGAEVVAGALSEAGVGVTLGETTYGTGTVLTSHILDDGSMLVLGEHLWLTPSGKSAWKVGLKPQIPVALENAQDRVRPEEGEELTADELAASGDTQLQRAIQLIGSETGER